MVNWKSKKVGDVLVLANIVVGLILINMLASSHFFRLDLTEEGRYSIKAPTKEIVNHLDDKVYIEVYLDGDLTSGFKRFRNAIEETLEEFRIYSDNKIQYTFVDPTQALGKKAQSEFMGELASKGIRPTNVIDTKDGQRVEKIIFPGALISFGGQETGVMLLKGNKASSSEEEINQSIEGVEFEIASAIHKLTAEDHKRVGVVTGHGELDSLEMASFTNAMLETYDVSRVNLARTEEVKGFDALVIAKPKMPFSVMDKYKLDQYIVNGGKVIFLIDKLEATMDSASNENYFAFPYDLNLDDQLFKYGIRLNLDLLQDRTAGMYPVVTGESGGKAQMRLLDWPFFPLINHYAEHPITRNLDAVLTRFVSSVDTVKAVGIRKTPLMMTSQYTRDVTAPVNVSVNNLRKNVKPEDYTKSGVPVGYLLEGSFTSIYKNRFLPDGVDQKTFKGDGVPAKIVVVADGDVARNDVNPRTGQPQVLGYDQFTKYTFANQDFLMNALAYLTNENGLIRVRNKEVKIRPLDKEKVKAEKVKWRIINLGLPLVVLILFGVARLLVRRRKYASFNKS